MMAVNAADATPRRPRTSWELIDWTTVKRTVRRLQERIVKAFKQGIWRKVKDLQRLLRLSYHARLLAIQRVTTNKGWKTPGVDGVIWNKPEQKLKAANQLLSSIPQVPLRRIYIPKKNGKKRPLGIPAMSIRGQQALHALTLEPIAESSADSSSFGFRPARGCADAMTRLFLLLSPKSAPQWILEGDIKSCFDEISHSWLLDNIPMDKKVLQGWLKSGYLENGKLFPTERGTPQGGLASTIIANMVLDGLEKKLQDRFGYPGTTQSRQHKVYLVRYADDFVVTGTDEKTLKEIVLPLVKEHLKERGLTLSEEKTLVTHIAKGFDFLGQNVRKYGRKLLIKPSAKSVAAIQEKVSDIIKLHGMRPYVMVKRINSIIRGWTNFHRHMASKQTFSHVDYYIFQKLWRWARKRHPNKSRKWVKDKYFTQEGNRKWVFRINHSDKKKDPVKLLLAASTPIRRHCLIKQVANPYDPEWKSYFTIRHNRELLKKNPLYWDSLWEKQNHRCAICDQEIATAREGIIFFPKDNIALDKTTPLFHSCLIHLNCMKSKKTGSSPEGLISA